MSRFLCGVPESSCQGSRTAILGVSGWKGSNRTHTSSTDAFKCYQRWRISEGDTPVGNRELLTKSGSVLVLTKKSRFGGKLRKGKEGKRQMPIFRHGGIIIST
jgi:hypothetical protein